MTLAAAAAFSMRRPAAGAACSAPFWLQLLQLLQLFCLLQPAGAGQIPIYPIFSPCNFPSPVVDPDGYTRECSTTSSLKFICDLNSQLQYTPLGEVDQAYEKYRRVYEYNNHSNVGILLVRHLEQPSSPQDVFNHPKFACFFKHECNAMESDAVSGFANNAKTFFKVYTQKLHERWFDPAHECAPPHASPNILVLISVDGLVNDARKMPYVKIYSADGRLHRPLLNVETETQNALVQNLPLQQVLKDLIVDLGIVLREYHELGGEPRDHSVPRWARHLGLLCFALILFALITEWYIVRRKLAVKKSASGIKIVSAKSKTHLMF